MLRVDAVAVRSFTSGAEFVSSDRAALVASDRAAAKDTDRLVEQRRCEVLCQCDAWHVWNCAHAVDLPGSDRCQFEVTALINNLPDRRGRPVYICVRSLSGLQPVLADLGAKAAARQAVMVKHLARLVKEGQTVPAVPSGVSIQPSRVSKVEQHK